MDATDALRAPMMHPEPEMAVLNWRLYAPLPYVAKFDVVGAQLAIQMGMPCK